MNLLFVSLGCDKNLVDSEEMIGIVSKRGYEFTDDETQAEIIVINTCCFINDAKEESINTILEMAAQKKKGVCQALIVTGCMAERYRQEIIDEIPEVDALLGTASYSEIAEVIEMVLNGRSVQIYSDLNQVKELNYNRVLTTGGHYAHLKISEGCDKCCTYCVIPKVRGNYRSIPMDNLLKQAEILVSKGVKELILVAQETTVYGVDLYGKKMLPELLRKLCAIEELVWIRIMYCYPEEITDEIIQTIKEEEKICKYVDMPIQHSEDEILKRMGRRTDRKQIENIVEKLRKEIPGISIRTTLISGFPGETDEDHENLMDFVRKMQFDRLGVFTYSREDGTPAAKMKNQVTKKVSEKRRNQIMELQQEIAFEKAESRIGEEVFVMIEGQISDENAYIGRTYMDAPNIDGNIFITTDATLVSGDFVKVRITGASEYDLIGDLI